MKHRICDLYFIYCIDKCKDTPIYCVQCINVEA